MKQGEGQPSPLLEKIMQVIMRTTASGPKGTLYAGQEYNLDPLTARAFIEGGFAVEIPVPAPKPAPTPLKPTKRQKALEAGYETTTDE